jgi:hypothetical protein
MENGTTSEHGRVIGHGWICFSIFEFPAFICCLEEAL